MDNAKILYQRVRKRPEELKMLKILSDSSAMLHLVCANAYCQYNKSNARVSKNYIHRVEVGFDDELYKRYDLLVSVGFYKTDLNSFNTDFYIICTNPKLSDITGLKKDTPTNDGLVWYKVDNIITPYTCEGLPDFIEISKRVESIQNYCRRMLSPAQK